ncbi:hypothetical protein L1987_53102 [Smallanthus sonchifolius]|uniref:Uncharacterized protein n=1 Tax=Smallanthus sonchifolius TaxID=185202 RepID=A0ACB9EUZ1_9ASTR|nr:hypothetical protein L1987_53102 [Smallanthus sonchifolius]
MLQSSTSYGKKRKKHLQWWKNILVFSYSTLIGKQRVEELGRWVRKDIRVRGNWWDWSRVDIAAGGLYWFA